MTDYSAHQTNHGHPIAHLASALERRVAEFRRRRHFQRLNDLDDHMLKDIGVTRGEVEIASNLPLSVDAAIELRRMSLGRRRKMM